MAMAGKRSPRLEKLEILSAIAAKIEPLRYVHAMWEGGSAAFGRDDEWSDVDLYICADRGKAGAVFKAVEGALKSISPISQKLSVPHPPNMILEQAFYRLERAGPWLVVDLAVLAPESPEKLLDPQVHGKAIFCFNKGNKVKIPKKSRKALDAEIAAARRKLAEKYAMFYNFIDKEIMRKNWIDATMFYHMFVLACLTDAIRMKYTPWHHNFKMRYAEYELPTGVLSRLRPLYFIKDPKDLQKKAKYAANWFKQLMAEGN